MNTKKSLLASTIAFFMGSAVQGVVAQDEVGGPEENEWALEEIVVTASKRKARLQDTAMAISTIGETTIEKRGLIGMGDYLSTVPGVTAQDRGAGQNSIVIRGLSSNPQADSSGSSAGVYFGETSVSNLGSNSGFGGSGNADIKLVDIERIEILRGPQGTLYGSGSLAGTVRLIPNEPVLSQFQGSLTSGFSATDKAGENNTVFKAVINVPIIQDTLAMRGVAYKIDNSGYIKNVAVSQPSDGTTTTLALGGVVLDRDDVGNDEYTGIRLSTLWKPNDIFDVTLMYTNQEIEQDGSPDVNLDLSGRYEQRRVNTGPRGSRYEFLENEIDIVNLVANYDIGWGVISSSSSLVNYQSSTETDFTAVSFLFGFPDHPIADAPTSDTDVFSEEIRIVSQLNGPIQFTAGLYYEDTKQYLERSQVWGGSGVNPLPPTSAKDDSSTKQIAAFGEVTYELNEKFEILLGARLFDYDRDRAFEAVSFGLPIQINTSTDETGQSYKFGLKYNHTDNTQLYGSWAEGFRLGDGQAQDPLCTAEGITNPTGYDSDTSENIELGFKSLFLENRISFNAALFHIDWKGIPVTVNPAGVCFYIVNAGKAESDGVEIELAANLSNNIQLDLSASYGETVLVGDSNIGIDGQDLPGSADFNANVGIQYDFVLSGYNSFLRADYSYIGEYHNSFDESGLAAGGFGQINLKAGATFNMFSVDFFVRNLTNSDDLTWIDSTLDDFDINRANRIRPRTIGFNLSYLF